MKSRKQKEIRLYRAQSIEHRASPSSKHCALRSQRGFTLLETLVAIFILLISITGPMAFSQSGLRAAFVSRDQVTAFYLAQDVIEYVKNVRDNNMIDNILSGGSNNWLSGLDNCISGGINNGCTIDTYTNTISLCSGGTPDGCIEESDSSGDSDGLLRFDSTNKRYGFNGSEDSIFSREVFIDETTTDVEAAIVVKIRWKSHNAVGLREIVVRENIFNWATELNPTNN